MDPEAIEKGAILVCSLDSFRQQDLQRLIESQSRPIGKAYPKPYKESTGRPQQVLRFPPLVIYSRTQVLNVAQFKSVLPTWIVWELQFHFPAI